MHKNELITTIKSILKTKHFYVKKNVYKWIKLYKLLNLKKVKVVIYFVQKRLVNSIGLFYNQLFPAYASDSLLNKFNFV